MNVGRSQSAGKHFLLIEIDHDLHGLACRLAAAGSPH
jgi:hypothetical protein